jgi:hypothetical protein
MCCLRYEHEFYVQSRKRFPKEGKIVVTRLGEEKVLVIDIFHERVTLRGVEGELRSLTLAEFKEETGQHSGVAAPVTNGDDEDTIPEGIHPEEISPELMYTAEHQVPAPRANIVSEHHPEGNGRESDGSGKRRRGRRGGRRGRGGDDTPSGRS